MKITPRLLKKIQYLCRQVSNIEWSGVLIYTIEGDLHKDASIVCEDLLLMDVGSSAYTEYEFDSYYTGKFVGMELYEKCVGHIHSHHHMRAYFSSTDMSELHDNVDKYNQYLSLIVNNEGNYVAKVAVLGTSKSKSTNLVSFNDHLGQKKEANLVSETEEEVMLVYDCEIEYEIYEDEELWNRIISIEEEKEKKRKEAAKRAYKPQGYSPSLGKHNHNHNYRDAWGWDEPHLNSERPTIINPKEKADIEDFVCRWILQEDRADKFIFVIKEVAAKHSDGSGSLYVDYAKVLDSSLVSSVEDYFNVKNPKQIISKLEDVYEFLDQAPFTDVLIGELLLDLSSIVHDVLIEFENGKI